MDDKGEWEFDFDCTDGPHWKDRYTYVLPLKEPLKPKSKYGFHVSNFFADTQYFLRVQPFDLIFETK